GHIIRFSVELPAMPDVKTAFRDTRIVLRECQADRRLSSNQGGPMELGCLFAPTTRTAEHIAVAEALGYQRALVYDSLAFLADPWITLALAAARTSRIRLGVASLTPRLMHVDA